MSFVPIDDKAGDLAAVEDLSSPVRPSTATALEWAKMGQSSWWRTSIATLRRHEARRKKMAEERRRRKRRGRGWRSTSRRCSRGRPRGAPRREGRRSRRQHHPARTSQPRVQHDDDKEEREAKPKNESEKSEAAVGKAPKSEVKPEPTAAHCAKKEERLQKSLSLSVIGQVAEEMEQRSSSKARRGGGGAKGPLPVRTDMPDRQRKRHQVINEIVNVRDLQVLLAVFVAPMQSKGIVTAEEAKLMFSNVKTLLAINKTLLSDLIGRVKATHGNNLGDMKDVVSLSHRISSPSPPHQASLSLSLSFFCSCGH